VATETQQRRSVVDADLNTGALLVHDESMYEVIARRVRNGVHEVMLEDLATPTAVERMESRLENAGRCEADPARAWRPVRDLVGTSVLVRPPISLHRFTA
jgi:hypothetical protein